MAGVKTQENNIKLEKSIITKLEAWERVDTTEHGTWKQRTGLDFKPK